MNTPSPVRLGPVPVKRIRLARGRSGIVTATLWETRWWTEERYFQVEFGRDDPHDLLRFQSVLTRFSAAELAELHRLSASAQRVIRHYRDNPASRPTSIFDAVPYEHLSEEQGWELVLTNDPVPGTPF